MANIYKNNILHYWCEHIKYCNFFTDMVMIQILKKTVEIHYSDVYI